MNRVVFLLTLLTLITSACSQKPAQLPAKLPSFGSTSTLTSLPKVTLNPQDFPLSDYGPHHAGKTTVVLKDPVDDSKIIRIGLYYPAIKPEGTSGALDPKCQT